MKSVIGEAVRQVRAAADQLRSAADRLEHAPELRFDGEPAEAALCSTVLLALLRISGLSAEIVGSSSAIHHLLEEAGRRTRTAVERRSR